MAARRTASPRPAPRVAIDVAMPCRLWRKALGDAALRAEAAARAALAGAVPRRRGVMELSLVLADDALVRTLNRRWRGRNRATNVLSFASGDDGGQGRPRLLGDVVLAYETVAREAAAQGKTLADHLAHLVTHGVLHLAGFDHAEDEEAQRMERLERRVLARIGVGDPYRWRESASG
jgi:probable rRNA maturation factor